jgi:glc operon protein GlcG
MAVAAPQSAAPAKPAPPAKPTAAVTPTNTADSHEVASKKALTLEGARRAIDAAVAEAKRLTTTGVVAVVDDGGNLMAVERIDGTFSAGANISIGKARTAALFKKPTRAFEEIIKNGRTPMIALNDFTPLVGGIPLMSGGQVVGGIGVSGAASADQDEQLALAGAKALAASAGDRAALDTLLRPAAAPAASPKPVSFFGHEVVDKAFAQGVPLLETAAFKIHASRREAPGLAEVHSDEADVAYVQEGTATLITGGALQNPRVIGPNELRGDAITGGEARDLHKGDVVVIPSGVPHWFKAVSKPFTYYVVKVHG